MVRLNVETPMHLTGKQRDLLKQFEKEDSGESQPGCASFLEKAKDLFK